MTQTIVQRIIHFLTPMAKDLFVTDVRIGLIYTSVRLNNGHTGIAWTGAGDTSRCMHHTDAGTLCTQSASALLARLASTDNALDRSIGLATANALSASLPTLPTITTNILDILNIQADDHVTMIGFFGPLIPKIRQTNCQLDVVELNKTIPGTLSPAEGNASLAQCDVAIITGTSLVTQTMDNLLAQLTTPRAVVILGPSTFMRPEIFTATPVTHLAGSYIEDTAMVERIISEGGGTKSLKPYLRFDTLSLSQSRM